MTDGPEERLARLRARFLERCREDREVLAAAPDAEAARAVLHRLAGAGGTFGFTEISRMAAAAEDALLSGRTPALAPLIAALERLPGSRAG